MDRSLSEFYNGAPQAHRTPLDMVKEALKDPHRARREIIASLCRDDFYEYTKRAWPHINPSVPFVEGRVLRVLCDTLQAVTEGKIKRLLINIPPGTAKTTITNVLWPSWEWGPRNLPHLRYISASYQETLATTAIVDSRRLVLSPWYQSMWPIEFAPDANEKTLFKNTKTGFRKSVSVGGALLGFRGDRLIIDDPHDRESAESEVERAKALNWWSHTVQTRLNDPARSAIVVIMQRLHVSDISGHILSKTPEGWTKLILPMEYDPSRHCEIPEIGYSDWRTTQGELLFPERFSRETVDELKRNMSARGGSYAVAGQLQQLPIPETGGMFKGRPRIVDTMPHMRVRVRGWDLAATEGKGDYTCGVLLGIGTDNQIYILDVVRFRGSAHAVTEKIMETADKDGHGVHISIPQDPGQAGKHQKSFLASKLHGFNVHFSTETGSKPSRAKPLAAQWEANNVNVKRAGWNDQYIDEALLFPTDEIDYDDQIDGSTRAYARALQVNGPAQASVSGGILIEYPSE